MNIEKTKKARNSRIGDVIGEVKEALSSPNVSSTIIDLPKISIPSTEVGLERNDYGSHQKLVVRNIDPEKCRPWNYHNRDEHWFDSVRCNDLISSIQANGQLEVGGVRKLLNDPQYEYEIIYGVRRWFACKELKIRFKARILDKTDRECMILMHIENADSKDISDFERAFSFKQQLQSGHFVSQGDMAKAFNLSAAMVSKYISAGSIYDKDFIRKLLPDKTNISIRKATELSRLLSNNASLEILKNKAEEMIEKGSFKKWPASKIFNELLSLIKSDKEKIIESGVEKINCLEGIYLKLDSKGHLLLKMSPKIKNTPREKIYELFQEILNSYVGNS